MDSSRRSLGQAVEPSKDQAQARCLARAYIEGLFRGSKFGSPKVLAGLPMFDRSELILGSQLGAGAFSFVDEIKHINLKQVGESSEESESATSEEADDDSNFGSHFSCDDIECRNFISEHCTRDTGDARYAIKILRPETMNNHDRFATGLCDLVVETRVLARLEHPHIIKLRAISAADPFVHGSYFLVLDRLYDTLEQRLQKWKREMKGGFVRRCFGLRKSVYSLRDNEERLQAAYNLSEALNYMHRKRVIHRDLKPDNIGFDIRDDIKIFDLGMARELRKELANRDGTYNLSGMTGTLRYMAPEVAMSKPYNSSCDVYSFTILFWQILTLKKPFKSFKSFEDFTNRVYIDDIRPRINNKWSTSIKLLLRTNWHSDCKLRMTMVEYGALIRQELIRIRAGDDTGLRPKDTKRRRSTFVFNPREKLVDLSSSDFILESFCGLDESGRSSTGLASTQASGVYPSVEFRQEKN